MKVKVLLEELVQLGASDLHLKPGIPPVVRLNGRLHEAHGATRVGVLSAETPTRRTGFASCGRRVQPNAVGSDRAGLL